MSYSQPTWTQINPAALPLSSGQTGGAVVFPVPFFSAPFLVLGNAQLANAGNPVLAVGIYGVSATGFSYTLSPVPPDGTYTFNWQATAFQPAPASCNPCGPSPCYPPPCPTPAGSNSGQNGSLALVNGADTGFAGFPFAFQSIPRVVASVINPGVDSDIISAAISGITTTGFSFSLTAPPGNGYVLDWIAVGF